MTLDETGRRAREDGEQIVVPKTVLHLSERARRCERGRDIVRVSETLKFVSGQENHYSAKYGTWDDVNQNLKIQSDLP